MSQLATITSKRQLTIPALIFRSLGLKEGQKVLVSERGGGIRIEPALEAVESLAGSVKIPPRFKKASLEKIISEAKKERFEEK